MQVPLLSARSRDSAIGPSARHGMVSQRVTLSLLVTVWPLAQCFSLLCDGASIQGGVTKRFFVEPFPIGEASKPGPHLLDDLDGETSWTHDTRPLGCLEEDPFESFVESEPPNLHANGDRPAALVVVKASEGGSYERRSQTARFPKPIFRPATFIIRSIGGFVCN